MIQPIAPFSYATFGLMPLHDPPYFANTIFPFTSIPKRESSS